MTSLINTTGLRTRWLTWLIIAGVLVAALALGYRASRLWLALVVAGVGALVLTRRPVLGLFALVVIALMMPMEIETGTEVPLNLTALLLPVLLGLWLLVMILRGRVALVASPVNAPLLLFVAAGLLSLLVGLVLWDPAVPRNSNLTLVQLAQWMIFTLSAGALLLTGNLVRREEELRGLTYFFLAVGGTLAVLRLTPVLGTITVPVTTEALIRAPFWVLLGGLAGGQLLFNRELTLPWRLFLMVVAGTAFYYSYVLVREGASNWVGLTVTVTVLGWLRWPQLRWVAVGTLVAMLAMGLLFPAVYGFAGGDEEWFRSGGSRLALTSRVLEDTFNHNPVTGLGPAAYRAYGATRPLQYEHIIWILPRISSHNNYVDIFGHMGILGLALFVWLALAITRVGFRLRKRGLSGFATGFVNGMLAIWAGSLALMLLADWILPFVYNIGFPGFQASSLVWLFFGGLVGLQGLRDRQIEIEGE